jgi:hypothetical protein
LNKKFRVIFWLNHQEKENILKARREYVNSEWNYLNEKLNFLEIQEK